MKHNFKIFIGFLIVLAAIASLTSSAYADSRTATVRVSCTIMPVLEVTLPVIHTALTNMPARSEIELKSEGPSVNVNTNLGKDYQLAESFTRTENSLLHLYSVTAL